MSDYKIEIRYGKGDKPNSPEGKGELQFEGPFGPMYVKFIIWQTREGKMFAKFDGSQKYKSKDGNDCEFRVASLMKGADNDAFSDACVAALREYNERQGGGQRQGGSQNNGGNRNQQGGGQANGANSGWGNNSGNSNGWGQNSGGNNSGWGGNNGNGNGNSQGANAGAKQEDDDPIPF